MAAIPLELDDGEAGAGAADEIVEECLADALGPWLGVMTPEQVAEQRALLTAFILTHPAARPLYDGVRYARLRAQPGSDQSGDVAKDGVIAGGAGEAERLGDGTTGGRR
jgi:hypothetical protein